MTNNPINRLTRLPWHGLARTVSDARSTPLPCCEQNLALIEDVNPCDENQQKIEPPAAHRTRLHRQRVLGSDLA
jgi:hypothetical protein